MSPRLAVLLGVASVPIALASFLSLRAQEAPRPAAAQDAPKAEAAKSTDDAIAKIKEEGLERSQVMQTLSYLTDVIGPRLTGSPNLKRANDWTRQKLSEWGCENAHLEAWGPFGRGWSLKRYCAQVTEPQCIPLIGVPKAWSPGTGGEVNGPIVYLDAKNEEELEKYKGQLKGAIVLLGILREPKALFDSPGVRFTDKE